MMIDGQTIISVGGLIAIFGLVYKANKDNNNKIGRLYGRLDEVKKEHNTTYTRKDVCEVRHEQITNDLSEIKQDVKKILNRR